MVFRRVVAVVVQQIGGSQYEPEQIVRHLEQLARLAVEAQQGFHTFLEEVLPARRRGYGLCHNGLAADKGESSLTPQLSRRTVSTTKSANLIRVLQPDTFCSPDHVYRTVLAQLLLREFTDNLGFRAPRATFLLGSRLQFNPPL